MDISFLFSGSPSCSGSFIQLFSFFQGTFIFLALARGSRGRKKKGGRKGKKEMSFKEKAALQKEKQQMSFREKAALQKEKMAQESPQAFPEERAPVFIPDGPQTIPEMAAPQTVPEATGPPLAESGEAQNFLQQEFMFSPPPQPSIPFEEDDEVDLLDDDDEVILVDDDDEVVLVDEDDEVVLVDEDDEVDDLVAKTKEKESFLPKEKMEEIPPETTTPLFERKDEEEKLPSFAPGSGRDLSPEKQEAEVKVEPKPSYGFSWGMRSFDRKKVKTRPTKPAVSPWSTSTRRRVREGEKGFSVEDEIESMDFKDIENIQRRMRLNKDIFERIEKKFPEKVELENYLAENDEWWDEWERSF